MTKTKIIKGTDVLFDWGFEKSIQGKVIGIFPGGRYGNNYEIKIERPIMIFGKMSRYVSLRKHEFITV